ncbi:unnamed protein product, partial [Brachionus calyciflorus]
VENFELMLREINGDPEEEKELLSDCSDSESESGSSSTSDTESVKGILVSSDEGNDKLSNDSNLAGLDANNENLMMMSFLFLVHHIKFR